MKHRPNISCPEITQKRIYSCRAFAHSRRKQPQLFQREFSRVISRPNIGNPVISVSPRMPLAFVMMKTTQTTAAVPDTFLRPVCGRATEAKRIPGSFGHRLGTIRDHGIFILTIALAFSWLVAPTTSSAQRVRLKPGTVLAGGHGRRLAPPGVIIRTLTTTAPIPQLQLRREPIRRPSIVT
jgi:hypothetical protein